MKRGESGRGQTDRSIQKSMSRKDSRKHLNSLKQEPNRSEGPLKTRPGNADASLRKMIHFRKDTF